MKKAILGALFAGAMLASCSSDEPVVNGGEDNNVEGGFVAVNIIAPPSTAGSRAATDGGFEQGTDAESNVTSSMFLLFGSNNKLIETQTPTLSWESVNETVNPHREKISSAVLVVNGANEQPSVAKILVILNAPSALTFTSGAELSTVLGTIGTYSSTNAFVMSNSVYQEDIATSIEGHIFKDAELAKTKPVEIYVERVLAKVRANTPTTGVVIKNSAGNASQSGETDVKIGEETVNLKVEITGVEVANMSNMSYLFKNGYATWNSYENALDAAKFRSYWATSVPENTTGFAYQNKSYDQITTDDAVTNNAISAFTEYVQENTNQTDNKKTAILITAQLKKNNAGYTFVKWGGQYWDGSNFGAQASNVLNEIYRVKKLKSGSSTDYEYNSLPKECFDWMPANSNDRPATWKVWENTMIVKSDYKFDGTLVKKNTSGEYEECEKTDVNNTLKKKLVVWVWNEGKAYYYVPIESLVKAADTDTENLCGVVRNHIYDLTIESIKGVGVPVWNPEQTIIPERPDDSNLFYVAARINILKWKVVNQTVNFE